MITYLDYNEYKKRERGLKRYFKKAYKYLVFEAVVKLKESGKIDGVYQVDLPTEELFEKTYGKIILKFSVKNDIAIIEDIEPSNLILQCYMKDLPVYKGIPYVDEKDLFRIKLNEKMLGER